MKKYISEVTTVLHLSFGNVWKLKGDVDVKKDLKIMNKNDELN